jgi:hypothetical protein
MISSCLKRFRPRLEILEERSADRERQPGKQAGQMNRISSLLVFGIVLFGGTTAYTAEDNPVTKKLDAAKVAYKEEIEKYRKAVDDWFSQRENAARKDGNRKLVDRIKAEREAFQETGELPKFVSPSLKKMQAVVEAKMESAYATAIREFTKAKMDDEAAATEKELNAFRAGIRPGEGEFKAFQGTWEIKFLSGATHTYEVRANGKVRYSEAKAPLTRENMLYKKGKDVLLRFEANKLERWSLIDGTLHVEHWHPLEEYAKGVPAGDVGKGNKK